MPVIRSAVRSSINDTARKAVASPWRYFLTFDPVLNSYAEIDTAFQPSGDFEIEVQVSTISNSKRTILHGTNQNNDSIGLRMEPNGTVLAFVYVGSILQSTIASTATINDDRLHTVKVTYTGTTAKLFIDGASEGTATWALNGNQSIKYIGYKPGIGERFNGIIANVKLRDLATSANNRIFPLNTLAGTENSTINTGSITINNIPASNRELFTFDEGNSWWAGSNELVTNGTFDTDSNWAKSGGGWSIAGGTANCSGDQVANTDIYKGSAITDEGVSYLSVFTVTDYQNGFVRQLVGGTEGTARGGIGTYSEVITTTVGGSTRTGVRGNASFIGSVDNVSVKRILEVA